MSDRTPALQPADPTGAASLARSLESLSDHLAGERAARDRFEARVLPLLERIAAALERGAAAGPAAGEAADRAVGAEVRAAITEKHWERARSIVDALRARVGSSPESEELTIELDRARDRAVADLNARIEAARQANDAAGALAARDELAECLGLDELQQVDRTLIGWLMKLIQRRLRSIPIGADLAALAADMAGRFGGTPEGASLRAALPTLRRSAGLCPRCAEPYLGVDEACPKCLELAGQVPSPTPTLTFVTDDLDAIVGDVPPVDLNNVEIWQLP